MQLNSRTAQGQDSETFPSGEAAGDKDLAGQWARVRARMQSEIGEVEYRRWLRQAILQGVDGDEVTIVLPTKFLRDWVNKEYGAMLTGLWQAENSGIRQGVRPIRGYLPVFLLVLRRPG